MLSAPNRRDVQIGRKGNRHPNQTNPSENGYPVHRLKHKNTALTRFRVVTLMVSKDDSELDAHVSCRYFYASLLKKLSCRRIAEFA